MTDCHLDDDERAAIASDWANDQNELVTRCAPRWAWTTIDAILSEGEPESADHDALAGMIAASEAGSDAELEFKGLSRADARSWGSK
jgi:hypothetical protein